MNCKPGDLAVIVNDPYCNQVDLGRIVEVICQDREFPDEWQCRAVGGGNLAFFIAGNDPTPGCVSIPDKWLRPIRDSGGEDETLTWAPVPQKVAA